MAVFQNNLLAGAGAQSSGGATYTIDQSIRFNPADSAYMSRTPSGSSSSRKKWTFSGWFKRGNITPSSSSRFFNVHSDSNNFFISQFQSDDSFNVTAREGGSEVLKFEPARRFRDPSAWYHVVMAFDSTNSIGSERFRVYFNGVRDTTALETTPSADLELVVLENCLHQIGRDTYSGSTFLFDGYMADLVLLDGTSTDCNSFGETNDSGIWVPKDVSGLTFGTNGFYIDGRDSSDLGDDESGQANDFTTSGLGAHDQVSDSPTNNFATFNSVYADVSGFTDVTFKNGNLQADATSSQFDHTVSTFNLPKSGKWYFEHYLGGRYTGFGICIVGQEGTISSGYSFGTLSTSQGFGFQDNVVYNGNSATVTFGGQSSLGDILNCAFDVDNNKVFLGINGTYYAADNGNDGNPSAGTNPTVTTSFSLSTNDIILGFYFSTADGTSFVNFGQEGTFGGNKTAGGNSDANGIGNFFNTVPTSYLALCSKNVGS